MISFAFVTKDKGYLVTQTTLANGIMRLKEEKDYVSNINNVLCHISGNNSDTYMMRMKLEASSNLYEVSLDKEINLDILTQVSRRVIHSSLRTQTPNEINVLLLGCNSNNSSKKELTLTNVDNYSAITTSDFIACGYSLYFLYGIADEYFSNEMSHDESVELINMCIKTLKEKMVLDASKWRLDVIDTNGDHQVQYIE